jgi:hypothetical protein
MKHTTLNTVKQAMCKLQEAIDLLESVGGEDGQIDDTAEALGFAYADLEYEVNSQ